MNKVITTAVFILVSFCFTGCERNDFYPQPNAKVVGEIEGCGWLLQYYEKPENLKPSKENTYLVVNLRKLFRVGGKELIVEATNASEAEKLNCGTSEEGYEQIKIINAVEYGNTQIYHNNN